MSNKSMRIIHSEINGNPTFRMMPILQSCPYNEVIYEPVNKILAVVSKDKKNSLKMVPKLNDFGDTEMNKLPNVRPVGRPGYKEQRVVIETYYEYHITDIEDISEFINDIAINTEFPYKKIMETIIKK